MEIIRSTPVINGDVRKTASDGNFIVSNTKEVSLDTLQNKCIIPNFAKDNESTISHAEFIEAVYDTACHVFQDEQVLRPAIRVSHPIKGRIPGAVGKPADQLLDHERTLYYERMAFSIEIPTIRINVNGNELSLAVGGVRAYNLENLYSRKSLERFKVFIGFKNQVCTNFCVSTDGYLRDIRVSQPHELVEIVFNLMAEFNVVKSMNSLEDLTKFSLTESQFAQVLGRMKMYLHLPKQTKIGLVISSLGDSQLTQVVRSYYEDNYFGCDNGNISLYNFYNLLTGANKSSYIDSFLDRAVDQLSLVNDMKAGLTAGGTSWYIQ